MPEEKMINKSKIRLETADITDLDIEAYVYYATEDLQLGSGLGTCISQRGGPSVQKELDEIGSAKLTEAVISVAGEMKAQYIVHSVGPKFMEEDLESKEGYKIWLGDKVIYVFETNHMGEEKLINQETGQQIFRGRYQLQLTRRNSGIYVSVLDEQSLPATRARAEDILWLIKDNISLN